MPNFETTVFFLLIIFSSHARLNPQIIYPTGILKILSARTLLHTSFIFKFNCIFALFFHLITPVTLYNRKIYSRTTFLDTTTQ